VEHHPSKSHHASSNAELAAASHRVAEPMRLLTVAQFWEEYEEPIDLLEDPEATFADDERSLAVICKEHGIAYRDTERQPAFPVWVLRAFYPENP